MARSHPSVGYLCEYLGISTFGDLPYLARVVCGLSGGGVKPPPVTGSGGSPRRVRIELSVPVGDAVAI